jgi:hypothetical protein
VLVIPPDGARGKMFNPIAYVGTGLVRGFLKLAPAPIGEPLRSESAAKTQGNAE